MIAVPGVARGILKKKKMRFSKIEKIYNFFLNRIFIAYGFPQKKCCRLFWPAIAKIYIYTCICIYKGIESLEQNPIFQFQYLENSML